jgi:hypothetical protein
MGMEDVKARHGELTYAFPENRGGLCSHHHRILRLSFGIACGAFFGMAVAALALILIVKLLGMVEWLLVQLTCGS